MPGPVLDFWFEFASTYSYPAAMRIGPLARNAGVQVRWRPLLLGPIFKAQGWDTSPFNLYPAKGATWSGCAPTSACRSGAPIRFRNRASPPPGSHWRALGRRGAKPSALPSIAPSSAKAAGSTTRRRSAGS
jgi:2-hydroxychromene-2-carboxylate isomerase